MSFDALEWLAAMTSHVPNKGEQMVNSRVVRELRRKLYQRAKQETESHWKKMIGKRYSGKPNVGLGQEEMEIEHAATTPALYSTEKVYG
jgi:hypothetical protein